MRSICLQTAWLVILRIYLLLLVDYLFNLLLSKFHASVLYELLIYHFLS